MVRAMLAGVTALSVLAGGTQAHAAFVFSMVEQGPDVVITGAGSFDLTGLTFIAATNSGATIAPTVALLTPGGPIDLYGGMSGPPVFGPISSGVGSGLPPSTFTGDRVGFAGTSGRLFVPQGYVSGDPLSIRMTFANETFASLGVTPGTYAGLWEADSVLLQIGQLIAVPEPVSVLLFGAGLLGLAAVRRQTHSTFSL